MKIYFSLLFLIFFSVFKLKGSNGTYWPCKADSDCSADNAECSIAVGECKCKDFDSVFSSDFSKCLKTSQFGDTCQETSQCNLMPSGAICKSGACDCADGQTYIQGRCKLLNGLHEACKTDTDCYFGYDRQSVSCKNYVCMCANGYYQRHGNICRRKSTKIDDACIVNTDCSELGENVRCVNFVCQVVKNNSNESVPTTSSSSSSSSSTIAITTTTKTPPTTTTATPKTSTFSSDSENNSDPFDAVFYRPVNGHSGDYTDAQIQTDEYTDVQGVGVQTSFESWDPRKPLSANISQEFKDVGTLTNFNNSHSFRNPRYHHASSFKRYHQLLKLRENAADGKSNSTLSNNERGDIDAETAYQKYGDACTQNAVPCKGLPHSICSNNICLCEPGYYANGQSRCFAELGEIAESAIDCENFFDETSKRCLCRKNFFYEPNLRSCRKPITFNLSCISNSQCSPFGAAYCGRDTRRRCTCAEYAQYDESKQLCVFKSEVLGAKCQSNENCAIQNSECSSNHTCVCKENYLEKNEECIAGVGARCDTDNDCKVENSVCETRSKGVSELMTQSQLLTQSETQSQLQSQSQSQSQLQSQSQSQSRSQSQSQSTCQCRKGFVHFRDECLKEAEAIEDPCVESEQCKPLLGTCIENKCDCLKHQHFKNGQCEDNKGLGENCVRASQCYVPKNPDIVECRNSLCQCKFGYQPERGSCARVLINSKNSSGRPSFLKVITFLLIGSAFLITSAAIRQAYF